MGPIFWPVRPEDRRGVGVGAGPPPGTAASCDVGVSKNGELPSRASRPGRASAAGPPIGAASGVPAMMTCQSSQLHIGSFQSWRIVRGLFSLISFKLVG